MWANGVDAVVFSSCACSTNSEAFSRNLAPGRRYLDVVSRPSRYFQPLLQSRSRSLYPSYGPRRRVVTRTDTRWRGPLAAVTYRCSCLHFVSFLHAFNTHAQSLVPTSAFVLFNVADRILFYFRCILSRSFVATSTPSPCRSMSSSFSSQTAQRRRGNWRRGLSLRSFVSFCSIFSYLHFIFV